MIIRGIATSDSTQIVIEIRDANAKVDTVRNGAGYTYSHATRPQPTAYRINHFNGAGQGGDVWQFTLRLSKPLLYGDEFRAIPNGNEANATRWLPVANATSRGTETRVESDRSMSSGSANQSRWDRTYRRESSGRRPEYRDPCEGYPLRINVDWATGSVSPVQLKRSGDYCVTILHANTILYSYNIQIEAEEIQGSPLAILKDATTALGDIASANTPAKAPNNKTESLTAELRNCDHLTDLMEDVKGKAADLRGAFNAMLPGETSGKINSIPLDATLSAWDLVKERFTPLKADADMLRDAKNAQPFCTAQVAAANTILAEFDVVQDEYSKFLSRVNDINRGVVRVPVDYLDSADNTKITVKEYYGVRETTAKDLSHKVPAGYHPISASAGFLVTQVPARTYSSRTSPDPSNLTATQNVLGVDYGSGFRPALTALLHYNLPFKQQRQFGLALTAGPVYDISGGKADTSKFGFFGGVSARFSRWLYVTPGFHIGEFADFPEGFTRSGQVIPANTGTPVPNKRYTTRFALAVTYKIKDLGAATTPAQ
jgi:hypothetical protein